MNHITHNPKSSSNGERELSEDPVFQASCKFCDKPLDEDWQEDFCNDDCAEKFFEGDITYL